MSDKTRHQRIHNALGTLYESLRRYGSADSYHDLLPAMFFLKFMSDVSLDRQEIGKAHNSSDSGLIEAITTHERFELPIDSNFYTLYKHRHEPGNSARIDRALWAIGEANYELFGFEKDPFGNISSNNPRLGETEKNNMLGQLLEDFAQPALNLRPSCTGNIEIIGDIYESLIRGFAANQRVWRGGFYTPPEVSDLIAELLDPQPGDTICDPTCGIGSLLIKCGRKIVSNHNSQNYALFGQEINSSTWSLAKMNMFLHGEYNHTVEYGDTICNPKLLDKHGNLKLFDVVVGTPPFLLDDWGHEEALRDKFGRFRRGIPPKTKGDYAFILHMIETLKPKTGRMGVVASHGVLFRDAREGSIRQKLIEENLLDAVIGLPDKLLYGKRTTPAILIFRRNKADDSVFFIDASREFLPGKDQNVLSQDNIQKIIATYRARASVANYAYLAHRAEIKQNKYNLSLPRYVVRFVKKEHIDPTTVHNEREQLEAQLAALETMMDKCLKKLGYGA